MFWKSILRVINNKQEQPTMRAVLHRIQASDVQTLGRFYLYDGLEEIFTCVTLELPDRGNQVQVSRIPAGTYEVTYRISPKFGPCFHVLDVPGRTWILIHPGNFHSDILGCILLGRTFAHLNADDHLDVASSAVTVQKLLHLTDGFRLTILDLHRQAPQPAMA